MIVSNVVHRRSASADERMIHDARGTYVSSSPYHTRTIKRRTARRERREARQEVRDSRQW
jgi:hypothetical protein